MSVNIFVKRESTGYHLVLTFDYDLDPIDFDLNPITKLISIYFSQISSDHYTIANASIKGPELWIGLTINQSFAASSGSAIFL